MDTMWGNPPQLPAPPSPSPNGNGQYHTMAMLADIAADQRVSNEMLREFRSDLHHLPSQVALALMPYLHQHQKSDNRPTEHGLVEPIKVGTKLLQVILVYVVLILVAFGKMKEPSLLPLLRTLVQAAMGGG